MSKCKDRPENVKMQQKIVGYVLSSIAAFPPRIIRLPFDWIRLPAEGIHEHFKILKRFKRWTKIGDGEELKILRRYASTGMVAFRFNCRAKQSEAKLTDQGKWFVGATDWSR